MNFDNPDLYKKAVAGDIDAARMYCGSYTLVMDPKGNLLRCKGDVPLDHFRMERYEGELVYDKDGFLVDKFWSLMRI